MSNERQEFTIVCHELTPNRWFYHIMDANSETILVYPAPGPMGLMSEKELAKLVEDMGRAAGLAEILDPEQDGECVYFMAEMAE